MRPPDTEPKSPPIDQEIARRPILRSAAGIAAIMAVALFVVWLVLHGLERGAKSAAPPPPPLAAEIRAAAAQGPPGPLLQANPTADMEEMRREEDRLLTSYGWVDRSQGIVRVPIARAIDLVLESGLPQQPASPTPTPTGAAEKP